MPAHTAAAPIVPTRNAERSRSRILEAAGRHFAERGFEASSLAAIGAEAGLSRGAPAYFFGSKAELYAATLDDAAARLVAIGARLAAVVPAATDAPAARIAALVEALEAALAAERAAVRLMVAAGPAATGRSVGQLAQALAQACAAAVPAGGDAASWQLLAESAVLLCWSLHALPQEAPTGAAAEQRRAHTVRLIVRGAAALVTLAVPSAAADPSGR